MKEDSEIKSGIARSPAGRGASASPFPASSASAAISKLSNSDVYARVPSIVRRLIAVELYSRDSSNTDGRVAFRVCEKLRMPLSGVIGVVGFRSLFLRALTLAKKEVPWLDGVEIGTDGVLGFSIEMQAQLDGEEAARAGTALIVQLLGLLITFIGEALTLRLVYNVWPKAATHHSAPTEKQP